MEEIRRFCPKAEKISIQLEDKYYQNGKKAQIRKIYDNFLFLVKILEKIIIHFLDFSVFPFYVMVIFNLYW